MRSAWSWFVVGGLALGLACSRSEPSEVAPPSAPRLPPGVAPKGMKMKSYVQRLAADAVTLTPAGAIANDFAGMVAFAPNGATWANAWPGGVRFFEGDHERKLLSQLHNAAGGIGFSSDSTTLRLGMHDVDVSSGAVNPQPDVADLAPWAKQAGLPAPPTLLMSAARKSDDGSLLVGAATGVTRDRRAGYQKPKSGDVDWLISFDSATRKPTEVMWHGSGEISVIAIGERHVAAGGSGPVRVFARDALGKELGTAMFATVIGVAWAPGDGLLGVIGDGKKIAIWRDGAWRTPAASWESGNDYQSALAFHPARPLLAVGNRDGHVRIYGVADGQLAKPPLLIDREVGGSVGGVAFSPDGASLLVSAGPPLQQLVRFTVAATP